ncbi:MAG: hypothetical protein K2X35_01355 [Bryobacteraceae bacterium]|nr:hypothetical protein [Bryobacteraceae bacterium]
MADQLYLSYWLRRYEGDHVLQQFAKLMAQFPFSRLARKSSVLRGYALEAIEPPLIERLLASPPDPELVMSYAAEFANEDVSYQLETWWDLWQYEDDWKLEPSPVTLACFGPAFDNPLGDHLRVELGPDTLFLPLPSVEGSARIVQSNVRSVLHLAHDLDQSLEYRTRRVWTEEGENFVDNLTHALEELQ